MPESAVYVRTTRTTFKETDYGHTSGLFPHALCSIIFTDSRSLCARKNSSRLRSTLKKHSVACLDSDDTYGAERMAKSITLPGNGVD